MIHESTKCATDMSCILCEATIPAGARAEVYTQPDHFVLCEVCFKSGNAEVLAAVKERAAEKAATVVKAADQAETVRRDEEAEAAKAEPAPLPKL